MYLSMRKIMKERWSDILVHYDNEIIVMFCRNAEACVSEFLEEICLPKNYPVPKELKS